MSINVNMKKAVIGIIVLLIVGGSVWWFVSTKDSRAQKAEIKLMIDYAQKQALEIAIIEQSAKLADYRKQIAAAQQKAAQPVMPPTPVADPKDVATE